MATLTGTETFTNKTLTSPAIGTKISDTNGITLRMGNAFYVWKLLTSDLDVIALSYRWRCP